MNEPALTDLPLERSLIAVALHDFGKAMSRGIAPDDFSSAECRTIWDLAAKVYESGKPVTHQAIVAAAGTPERSRDLAQKLAGYRAEVAPDHERLRRLRQLRDVREKCLYAASLAELGDMDGSVAALEGAKTAAVAKDGSESVFTVDQLSMRFLERLHDSTSKRRVRMGMELFAKAVGPLVPGSLVAIGADTNVGKALRATEPVLTPGGWVEIGKLSVGDEVIAVDGTATRVIGVFPQGVREIHRVRFDDGAYVDADMDHRWAVATDCDRSKKRPFRVMTTREIVDFGLVDPSGRTRWSVPTVQPVEHPDADLPVDPYLLGVLLGDGCFRDSAVGLSKKDDPEVVELCASALPDGVSMIKEAGYSGDRGQYRLCAKRGQPNLLIQALRAMGLMGLGSYDKFIPEQYLTSSIEQRSALLRGLLDTDGTVDATGRYLGFCTTSEKLRDGLISLVRSLGGVGRVCERVTHYTHNGEKRDGALSFIVSIAMPPAFVPFSCKRKADRFKPRTYRMPNRKIVAVEPAGLDQAVCISVNHPSKLYVTRDYIVTHNTGYALELLATTVAAKVKCGFISCEDPEDIIVPRLIAAHAQGLSSRELQIGDIRGDTMLLVNKAVDAMSHSLEGGLYFSFPIGGTESDVCGEMSRMVAKGCRVICVDYIQAVEPSKKQQDRRNEIRWTSSRLKEHANRLGVPLIVLSQLTVPPGSPPGWEPNKGSLKESKDLANMAETVILMWRQDDFDTAPITCKLDKSKIGNVGATWVIERDENAVVRERPKSYMTGRENFIARSNAAKEQAQAPMRKGFRS